MFKFFILYLDQNIAMTSMYHNVDFDLLFLSFLFYTKRAVLNSCFEMRN